jgi:hypothetical protein
MKKMIITLAVALVTFSSFANSGTVSQKVLDAFHTEFTTASEVEWTSGADYYKATFNYNGKYVFAYYNEDGELLGLTRYISPVDLPVMLENSLKKNYEGYWVSDLVEVSKNDGTTYYITLENADTKMVLKSSGTTWSSYTKIKKA